MKIIPEAKREPLIIRVRLLKRRKREVKVDPKFGGQWNVPSLLAIGMFHAWWPLEGSKLGGHWKVKEKPFSPLPFSPNNFTYTLNFFPLTSRFYFTMVLSRYSHLFFLFFNLYITVAHLNVTSPPHLHCHLDFD
jgi:hypothetical protein